MLDLTKIKEDYMKVKLPNGDIISLKKPTQSMIKYISDIEDATVNEQLEKITTFVFRIINRNKEGKFYTEEDIDNMLDINIMTVLVEGYIDFVREITNSPN